MALSLPLYTPPELLHRLPITQRLSASLLRRSARAKQEGRSQTQVAAADHVKVPIIEPCCKNTPLVIVPQKPFRRSSRLRVKKGRQESHDSKVDLDPTDVEAAEWVSRALANNGMVEIDPMTIAEQITAEKLANNPNRVASLTATSEVPDYFPPSNGGFPRIPYGVAIAAASAVVLATIAVIVQALRTPKATSASIFNQTELEGAKLNSDFAGEPVKREIKNSRKVSDAAAPASMAGAFAAALPVDFKHNHGKTRPEYNLSVPVPPNTSKAVSRDKEALTAKNKPLSTSDLDSVPPFFPSDMPQPDYESVTPFFPSDRATALENVTPFYPDEQGIKSNAFSEFENGPLLENTTPFFPDEQGTKSTPLSEHKNGPLLENITPFFPDEIVAEPQLKGVSSSDGFTPSSDQVLGSENTTSPKMLNFQDKLEPMSSQFSEQLSIGDERVFAAVPEDLLSGPLQSKGEQLLAEAANKTQDQHLEYVRGTTEGRLASSIGNVSSFRGEEAPLVKGEPIGEGQTTSIGQAGLELESNLSPEELSVLAELKAEEERQNAKYRALQAAFPALAIGAGAVGALAGVDGAFQMVGLTATASFISYELLWATSRKQLLDELTNITDHRKLFGFLRKRKIVKDC